MEAAAASTEPAEYDARTKRDYVIDFMRAVAIFLVVFGHAQRGLVASDPIRPGSLLFAVYSVSDYFIYTFHVPVFFAASGFFFEARSRRDFVASASRLVRLVTLYLVWLVINAIPAVLFSNLINRRIDRSDILLQFNPLHPPGIMWFFLALIVAQLLAALFSDRIPVRYAILAAAALALGADADYSGIAYGTFWFFVGGEVRRRKWHTIPHLSGPMMVGSLIVAILSGWICYELGVPTSAAFVTCAAAIICLYEMGRMVPYFKVVSILGQETLAIYVLHIIAIAGVRIMLQKIFGVNAPALALPICLAAGMVLPFCALYGARRTRTSRRLFLD
jgi:fucose 4-O-acetylase-like acetyltransferase